MHSSGRCIGSREVVVLTVVDTVVVDSVVVVIEYSLYTVDPTLVVVHTVKEL